MKKNILFLLTVLSYLFYTACDNMNHEENNKILAKKQINENIIEEQEAIDYALSFLNVQSTITKSQADDLISEVQAVFRPISIQNQQQFAYSNLANNNFENIPVYIINFKTQTGNKQGFVVEIGDKRVSKKILAFSDSGMWDMSNLPEFEHIFFEQTDQFISQSINEYQADFASDADPCDIGLFEEITKTTTKKCSMSLTWGQECSPYNDSVSVCTNLSSGHAPAGCVATAIAQIMAYHQKPTSGSYIHPVNRKTINTTYNWAGMKSVADAKNLTNTTYRSQVANLLAEIGFNSSTNYTCNKSGANVYGAHDAFAMMGYNTNGILIGAYDFSKVKSDIDANRPVYMEGFRTTDTGHAWVVEGYKIYDWAEKMVRECPNSPIEESYTGNTGQDKYLYFNLGHNGVSNGYYLVSSNSVYAANDFPYTMNLKTITNIKPN